MNTTPQTTFTWPRVCDHLLNHGIDLTQLGIPEPSGDAPASAEAPVEEPEPVATEEETERDDAEDHGDAFDALLANDDEVDEVESERASWMEALR